ncbi:ABC transporter permease [Thalassotalea sp. LPB0316]|uniref:ABC transporter permease/M1 family aminopeptidase n=1 Tax=Thalassotalea sp. LPB0316 TaxID=2769490 RepID=UPI0018666CE0|nr:M1 family aminopeptidase [Thalassotalea sp. LPB0316]QOL26439.1 ABC transporter permease [Thalassotalea sp. LPB0316]
MLAKMFLFEWRYLIRQPSFIVTSSIFFLLTFFATVSDSVQIGGGGNIHYNGPYAIAQAVCIMLIFSMFLVVNFVASTATRNETTGMSEILYSKPINPVSYQLGRFLGSFATVATVFLFVPLGVLVGCFIGELAGWVDEDRLGTTHLSYYITAYVYIALPTLLVMSCLFYAFANKFKSMMGAYLIAVALFILYSVAGDLLSDPSYRTAVALLDPFGFRTFGEVTRYWTMYDKNNTPIELTGVLLQNRILWLVIAVVILAIFGGFTRKVSLQNKPTKDKAKTTDTGEACLDNRIDYKNQGINTRAHLLLRTKFEIKQVVFSAPFLILSALTVFSLIGPLIDPDGVFGTPNWPVTQQMVDLIGGATSLLMLIIITYYSAEVVWRERNSGMGDMIDSLPVNNITYWLSKLIALTLVMAILYVIGTIVTLINQVALGYFNFELSQYAIRLGYINLVPLLMSVVLAFFLQVLSPNKYIGMLLFVLFIISTLVLSNFGFSHNMFQFGGAPRVFYSDINTYGHFMTAFNWYMLYWAGMCIALSAITYGLWHRGPAQPLKSRFKRMSYYIGAPGRVAIVLGLVIFVGAGSYIHYNTRVINEYVIQDDRLDTQGEYEKTYGQYKEDHIPTITQTHAKVDIYPSERRIEAVAEITVENKSAEPLKKFLISKPSFSKDWSVEIDGGESHSYQARFRTAWFEFEQALQPGEVRKGKLTVTRAHEGFTDGGEDFSLVENGTFINNFSLFPSFGYRNDWQIRDKHERKKRDLAKLERAHKLEESQYYNESFFGKGVDFIDFEATISTSEDQFAIAPGYLQSEEVIDGRRVYHYKMNAPIKNFYSIMSANLAAKKVEYKGINIEIYYHPDHAMNVDRMIESVQDSIDYFTIAFGPYQHQQMRIIEFPGYRSFAQSFANTVPYSEDIGFITDLRDPENVDTVYYVTAHEVAHQWWGHQVGAANVQGSAIISESLSQYAALMVLEKKYGSDKLRKFLKYELDRYLRGRSREDIEEMPFMRSEGQQYIHYNKGSVVMMAIRDRLGEARLNKALADFLTRYKYQSTPYPTTKDLMAYIIQDTSPEEQTFVTNLFEHITLYDLKTKAVEVAELDSGKFEVTITIDAGLLRADGRGKETPEDFVDMVDVGLFSEDPEDLSVQSSVQYLQKHEIKTGENIITLIVDKKPKYVGVDPFVKLIDRDSADNIYRL